MSGPRDDDERSRDAVLNGLAQRLDKPMGALGVLFVLVVLGQALARHPTLSTALTVSSWVLWAVFVAEFGLRAWLARGHAGTFWRRNWWQVLFLAVPFLRFARAAATLRAARAGGVITAAVRGSRSAGRLLTDRLAWLAIITTTVILSVGQLLVLADTYRSYGRALHDVALTTVTGEPLTATDPLAQVVELVLAVYSVVVFGTLAGALGAFFLSSERQRDEGDREQRE